VDRIEAQVANAHERNPPGGGRQSPLTGGRKPLGYMRGRCDAPVSATGGAWRLDSLRGQKMRRHVVALLLMMGCLLAGSAQAAEFRFPKTGPDAFVINLPAGWSTHEDEYNGIQLLAPDHRSVVYLSLMRDSKYIGKPLKDVAMAIGAQPNMTFSGRQEASTISGYGGQTFYAQMTNDKGTLLDVKMAIIPLD